MPGAKRVTSRTINPGPEPLLAALADFQSGQRKLPLVMGILNLTPDSFSDGGQFNAPDEALRQADTMRAAGADIIDIGGESTRPGAAPVSVSEELGRVIPVLEQLVEQIGLPVSVDSSKPEVMRAAAEAGASMINDVRALRAEGALAAAAASGLPVCLMHMQGEPGTMQRNPAYDDVFADVQRFLRDRIRDCVEAGISVEHIVVDPGFGFGKSLDHNLTLLRQLDQLRVLGCPILAGLSRKSMLGQITGQKVGGRLIASVAAAIMAFLNGASILRVHDVAGTVDGLKVAAAARVRTRAG